MRHTAVVIAALLGLAACISPGRHQDKAPHEGDAVFADIDGAWLRVRREGDAGEALPVVFVHGYGSRLESWREVQPVIARTRRTLSYDQRGFGLSERPGGEYGPERHATDLLELLDAEGIERAVLVGHSYGGGVAMRAALLAPERVAAIALIDAFLLDDQVPTSFRWAQVPVLGEMLFGGFYKEVPGEKYLLAFHDEGRFVTVDALDEMKKLMARPGSVYAALATVRGMDYADVERRYRDVAAPVLVVWGANDRVTPLSQGERLAGRVDAEEMVVLEACGHMPSWERPKALLHVLEPFFAAADDADADAAARAAHGASPNDAVPAPKDLAPDAGDDALDPVDADPLDDDSIGADRPPAGAER